MTCFRRELKPAPSKVTPPIGSNRAKIPVGLAAEFAVVLTVRVEVALPEIGLALSEHVGAGLPPPVTAHARATAPLKPPVAVALITELADPPGVPIVAEVGLAVSVKLGTALTVKVT